MWIQCCVAVVSLAQVVLIHPHVFDVFIQPEGNERFTTITVFTCKQCLADLCTAIVMNSYGLGGHIARKQGRMWHNVYSASTCVQLSSSHRLIFLFLCCCFASTHSEENKSAAAGEKICTKKRQFHICGQKKDVQFTLFPLQSLGLHF